MRKVKAKDKGIAKKLKLEEDDEEEEEEEENEDEDEEMESDDEGKLRNHVDLKGAWFGKMLFSLFPEYSSCFFFYLRPVLTFGYSCHNTEQQVWFSILLAVRYGVREAESYEPWWILSAPSGGGTV